MEDRRDLDLPENKKDGKREKRDNLKERITEWVDTIMPDRF